LPIWASAKAKATCAPGEAPFALVAGRVVVVGAEVVGDAVDAVVAGVVEVAEAGLTSAGGAVLGASVVAGVVVAGMVVAGAVLAGVVLAGVVLAGVVLAGVVLAGVVLAGVVLRDESPSGALTVVARVGEAALGVCGNAVAVVAPSAVVVEVSGLVVVTVPAVVVVVVTSDDSVDRVAWVVDGTEGTSTDVETLGLGGLVAAGALVVRMRAGGTVPASPVVRLEAGARGAEEFEGGLPVVAEVPFAAGVDRGGATVLEASAIVGAAICVGQTLVVGVVLGAGTGCSVVARRAFSSAACTTACWCSACATASARLPFTSASCERSRDC
jgi:hypothetical protein